MKNFFVITNKAKDGTSRITNDICEYIRSKGAKAVADDTPEGFLKGKYTDINRMPEDTDCVIVLGGDGTLLHAANDLIDSTVPLLGINLGTMGYLSAVDLDDRFKAIDKVLEGDIKVEKRMMLSGSCYHGDNEADSRRALNEIAITGNRAMQIVYVSLYINGKLLHRYSGDGIIIATPTGSTGYSLSAGGPIVSPLASMIIVTPVCAHSMQGRSLVFSPDDEITIRIDEGRFNQVQEVGVSFDASEPIMLRTGDSVRIRRSGHTTSLVRVTEESFIDTLHNKLKD
ncbi:MAG: NAD(+)/NADH kinase [Lachnospiraceae bacterium]|nr:NAD(+)/NADH kinase [Lachnospiraceae bacterium]